MSACKHCGAEQTGTGWGNDLYACGGASGHPEDVRTSECYRRENRQIAADRDRLRAELDAIRADGMPADREALQALLDSAYNKGRDDVHALYQTGAPVALLRAELDEARAANRVLDSAAKDAQSWAYQLQECRAELEALRANTFAGFDAWFESHFEAWIRVMRGQAAIQEIAQFRGGLLVAWEAAIRAALSRMEGKT